MVITKASQHLVAPASAYFFDTNVWLFIYGPIAGTNQRKQVVYSRLLKDIISHKATIFVSSLVLSEYINAVLHIGFKQWKRVSGNINANFKTDYRPTADYLDRLNEATLQVQEILKVCSRRPDDFHIVNIDTILSSMNQNADYNDAYYIHDCEKIGLKLVSDDTDMQRVTSPITLITA